MTYYIASDNLSQGDVVCLDRTRLRSVRKATPDNLNAARAALGIATASAQLDPLRDVWVDIAVTGKPALPQQITGLSAAPDHPRELVRVNKDARCERAGVPTPADYIIGVTDADGNLTIRPHCEVWTAGNRVLNFLDYGGIGDFYSDNIAAFDAAMAAVTPGDTLYFPSGTYYFADDVNLMRQVLLVGAGTQLTVFRFPKAKGVIIHGIRTSTGPSGTRADYSGLEHISIACDPLISRPLDPTINPDVTTWQSNHPYVKGDRVWATDSKVYYWECIRAGTSDDAAHPRDPTLAAPVNDYWMLHQVDHVIDNANEWSPRTQYHEGTIVRGTDIYDRVFECVAGSNGESGDTEPVWGALGGADYTYDPPLKPPPPGTPLHLPQTPRPGDDPGIVWKAIQRDEYGNEYLIHDGGVVWIMRAQNGIRMHVKAAIRDVAIANCLNAGVHISAAHGWDNANDWSLDEVSVTQCGVGVFVTGADANQGVATKVFANLTGIELGHVDTDPTPGRGAFGIWDNSDLGCQWIACHVEQCGDSPYYSWSSSTSNPSIGSANRGALIGCYSETAEGRPPSRLVWFGSVIGGNHAAGFAGNATGALVEMRDYKGVWETDDADPPKIRTSAGLIYPDAGIAQWWQKDPNDWAIFGWQYKSPYGPGTANRGDLDEWSLGLVNRNAYLSIADPFSVGGAGWRDVAGHFCGNPLQGGGYWLGLNPSEDDVRSYALRRGRRYLGDRFEPPLRFGRGAYIGSTVTSPGSMGLPIPAAGLITYASQFNEDSADPARTVEPGNGLVYRCSRSALAGAADQPVGVLPTAPPPVWPTKSNQVDVDGIGIMTWRPTKGQRVGYFKRPTRKAADGNWYYFECTAVSGYGVTGDLEPTWDTTIGSTTLEKRDPIATPNIPYPGEVTWTCKGLDDPATFLDLGDAGQWTCIGEVAKLSDYGPVYEKGFVTTRQNSPQETAVVDAYKIPVPIDKVCPVYVEVTVTCWDGSYAPAEAAVITLKSFWKPVAYDSYVLLGDIRSEGWGPISAEDFAVDMAEPFRVNLEYKDRSILVKVADFRGRNPGRPTISFPNRDIRWRSIRKPHIDWDW
jgi:Pectate lyase superfamily protein